MKNAVKTLVLGWIILIPIAAVVWSYRQQQPMQHEVRYLYSLERVNNHVGNQWVHEVFVDGNDLSKSGRLQIIPPGTKKQITILVVSTEDDSVPDVGSASMDVTLTENMNTTVTLTTNVRENRGRYTGSWAQWSHHFSIKTKPRGSIVVYAANVVVVIALLWPPLIVALSFLPSDSATKPSSPANMRLRESHCMEEHG